MTLEDTPNATSSQESAAGQSPYAWLVGTTPDLFGLEVALASHSAARGSKKEKPMTATSGLSGTGSLESQSLQSFLASRLAARLPTGGLTMFIKGWNQKVTPSGRRYCQLAVSAKPINATDYGLWPSPRACEGAKDSRTQEGAMTEVIRHKGASLSSHAIALWLTPRANEIVEPAGQGAKRLGDRRPETATSLGEQVASALWPTPNASDNRDRGNMDNPCIQRRITLGKQIGLTMLVKSNGYSAQTGKQGQLNPAFTCWLMGYPDGYEKLLYTVMAMR